MRSVFLCDNPEVPSRIFTGETLDCLKANAGLSENVYSGEYVRRHGEEFSDVEAVFSTWGMPVFTEEEIKVFFPALRYVFYGAGSVQAFARPFLNCGVRIFSAWAANAIPVAEYTVSQILLASKGFFQTAALMSGGNRDGAVAVKDYYPGNYDITVGIIGVGMIGALVAERLKAYNVRVYAFDPFCSPEKAERTGVTLCDLQTLFRESQVVSNHLANNKETVGRLNGELFRSMRPYATFINTGRGAQVVENELCEVLALRPDLTAVLDVTMPEPPLPDSPFYRLPNCFLTPHIAGSSGNEVRRMGAYMGDEFRRIASGEKPKYEVSLAMLSTMA